MSATATTEKKYLKWYQKLAYGSGDLASNCSYGLVSSFVLLYLTGTLGLDSAIIGSLMLASKVLDGISDVIFGTLIDRTHSKLGKARPWMLFGQVGVSLCLFLLFAIPAGSTTMQYIYFFIVYTALNAVFYTANGIAYSSLVALITKNNNERVQLGSFRFYVCGRHQHLYGLCRYRHGGEVRQRCRRLAYHGSDLRDRWSGGQHHQLPCS